MPLCEAVPLMEHNNNDDDDDSSSTCASDSWHACTQQTLIPTVFGHVQKLVLAGGTYIQDEPIVLRRGVTITCNTPSIIGNKKPWHNMPTRTNTEVSPARPQNRPKLSLTWCRNGCMYVCMYTSSIHSLQAAIGMRNIVPMHAPGTLSPRHLRKIFHIFSRSFSLASCKWTASVMMYVWCLCFWFWRTWACTCVYGPACSSHAFDLGLNGPFMYV